MNLSPILPACKCLIIITERGPKPSHFFQPPLQSFIFFSLGKVFCGNNKEWPLIQEKKRAESLVSPYFCLFSTDLCLEAWFAAQSKLSHFDFGTQVEWCFFLNHPSNTGVPTSNKKRFPSWLCIVQSTCSTPDLQGSSPHKAWWGDICMNIHT